MNAAHLHLIFNHLPIVGLGFAILFNLFAIFRKSPEFMKVSCWFYILIGLLSALPIITGDGAGEIIKTWPGISNDAIEYHETWGYAFFYGLIAIGALAIAALWFSRKNELLLKKFLTALLVVAVLAIFLAFQAGTTGGKIRHPEIEQGAMK
ncbi:MAG: hypothetical protein NTU98_01760 [Bacteroidetes bacterium]|nr:hypothetical protein [Bacteroidota bacterium]